MRTLSMTLILLICCAGAASGQIVSILGEGRGAFLPLKQASYGTAEWHQSSGGLFIGRHPRGLFADRPAHRPAFRDAVLGRFDGADVMALRALIEEAESRREGYDAVQHGARIRPGKRPTQMTLGEIFAWIEATPGQPHAIGRYQFIPATLRRVVAQKRLPASQRFDPRTQDLLADVLLAEAGLHRFRQGRLGPGAFMDNLARIWAGLPMASGRSYYAGYAGNKATVSRARFEAVVRGIAPPLQARADG